MTVQMLLSLMLALQLSLGMAATPVIGVATANGSFRLDHSQVQRNGTIFEGSLIETGKTAGRLQLSNGASISLGAETRGRIYRSHVVLESGTGEIRNMAGFGVETGSLRIVGSENGAIGRIQLQDGNRVRVTAVEGTFQVTNAKGILIASLAAGKALDFEPQAAGAAAPMILAGCVSSKDGKYFLTDETTKVTVELQGSGLEKLNGHRVEVAGANVPNAKPAANATQVVQVNNAKELEGRCSMNASVAAAGAGAVGAAAAGAATAGGVAGTATAVGAAIATHAVVAGVVVAAAAAGTAVAVTSGDDEPETISK